MIAGTNANCKIISRSISETTATITLLIFATNSTIPAKPFYIYVQDDGSLNKERVDNNTYWVDRVNVYNNDTNNVDTNKYKEIIIKIDITKNNTSNIIENKWVRNCYIYLIDAENPRSKIAWSSERLTLISDEFEVPGVSGISFDTVDIESDENGNKKAHVKVSFDLDYKTEKDFNYNNKNILATVEVKSVSSGTLIEKKTINTSTDLSNSITTDKKYLFDEPILIEIYITNRVGTILRSEKKIYRPFERKSTTFIKTKNGVKKVVAFYVQTATQEEHEGEWL